MKKMKEKIAGLSIFVNFILGFGKILVGMLSGSASIFAEGLHSGMDVFSSFISFLGIRISKKPVDERHPYGHYKFEVLAGLVITLILFLTGAFIMFGAYREFNNPSLIEVSYLALGIMAFSTIVNEVIARIKMHYGKKENSVALLSDGVHSRVDVFTSIAVFAGLILSNYWIYADSILAFFIGLYIIKESFSLGKEATDSLLDVSAGEEVESKIKEIAKKQNIEISELKTQKKGSAITANIEIKIANKLSVEDATKISDKLKEKLVSEIKNLEYVAIQIKSHGVIDGYFNKPEPISNIKFGRGLRWHAGSIERNGSGGYCVCLKCGYKIMHERGVPCSSLECPKCKIKLERENGKTLHKKKS